ncbi:alanine racemase [Kitasatospora sp. NBC_01266]|uniref:alanine racemase n=1 Tax=Kitasatospora sp. NBC_01266 TaxID=2903572 RepID=UPI002E31C4A2|nr:alanine racemase [Kitasatospora sp. NBC_01266]
MTLSLYLDTERWRAHQRSVLAEFGNLVPVAKGNGYGLGNRRLAVEAARLGTRVLAVGTPQEAAEAACWYGGELLVLAPYRVGEHAPPLPRQVIRTVASLAALRAVPAGTSVVIECAGSMRRHGLALDELPELAGLLSEVRLRGFALHLPLDRPDSSDPVAEVAHAVAAIAAAGLPVDTVFLSHLGPADLARLGQRHPDTVFHSRIGTRLWLGDTAALGARATVLDVTPVAKGDRYGYRQHKAPSRGHLLVLSGGTAHGIGLTAPSYAHGLVARVKGIAKAGLATVNRSLSPYQWDGRQLWFAEPPHMQVSILFLPGDRKPPAVGDELPLNVRHTTTHFDQVVDS